jgi:Pyruvate/2-oxoacid:ferredoxin oxidoreductase gamma subunit
MEREVLFTGIGGQGVQLAAQVLARAALHEGREVMPLGTYGGNMRGGNTDATVVLADGPISAPPIVAKAWAGVAMHPRYWDGVREKLGEGSVAAWNADLFATEATDAAGAQVLAVDATREATALGSPLAASLVLLGAFSGATGLVGIEALVAGMEDALPPYRQQHAADNARALRHGFEHAPEGAPRAWQALP